MNRLWFGNFHFEHELALGDRFQPNATLQRINGELAATWLAIAEEGDRIWLPMTVEEGFFEQMASLGYPAVEPFGASGMSRQSFELVPWGWTKKIREWAHVWRLTYDAPPQPVVSEMNSRHFSSRMETEWNVGLDGQRVLENVSQLAEAVRAMPGGGDRWCVKAEFGMSGRERVVAHGLEPSPQVVDWIKKRIKAGKRVFFEPWVERVDEIGLQFTVPKTGEPILEGIAELLVDANGAYRESRFFREEKSNPAWSSAIETGTRLAALAAERGYFGPLGIDAVRYVDHQGGIRLRPLADVNARFTMGRLSLGFRKLLQPGECGCWLHRCQPAGTLETLHAWYRQLESQLPEGTRMIRTSPFEVDGQAVSHGTFVLLAKSTELLASAEEILTERQNV
jgi:hypothetical protein